MRHADMPPDVKLRLRMADIRNGGRWLNPHRGTPTPALLYLARLAPGLDLGVLAYRNLFEHPALFYWAKHGIGYRPALVLAARHVSVGPAPEAEIATYLCIFLDKSGQLLAVEAPHLICGAPPSGAICVLKAAQPGARRTYLCETLETGLAIIAAGAGGCVAHMIKRSNVGDVALPDGEEVFVVSDEERAAGAAKLVDGCRQLRARGVDAQLVSSADIGLDVATEGFGA